MYRRSGSSRLIQKIWGGIAFPSVTAAFCATCLFVVTTVTKFHSVTVNSVLFNQLIVVTVKKTTTKGADFVTNCYKLLQTVTRFCYKTVTEIKIY